MQPRKQPHKIHADKGYDFPRCRRALRKRGIKIRIARRGVAPSERLGRPFYRRLCVRYERRADIHEAFPELACALVCLNRLRRGYKTAA